MNELTDKIVDLLKNGADENSEELRSSLELLAQKYFKGASNLENAQRFMMYYSRKILPRVNGLV